MLTDGKETTTKCKMCSKSARGATFSMGLFSVHLCVDCMRKVRDTLAGWVERLTADGR